MTSRIDKNIKIPLFSAETGQFYPLSAENRGIFVIFAAQNYNYLKVISNVCSWRTGATATHPGAQIDLLIARGDNVINVCEMKYSKGPFLLTQEYADQLERKMPVFREVTQCRASLHLTLISTFGLQPADAWNAVQSQVTMEDLFRD